MEIRHKGLILLLIFVTPLISPAVAADWDDDNWLWNLIGYHRVERPVVFLEKLTKSFN